MSASDLDSTTGGFIAAPPAEETACGRATPHDTAIDDAARPVVTSHAAPAFSATAPCAHPGPDAWRQAEAASGDPNVGALIGQFEIESVIASGGMGTVYKALQREPVRRSVALKMIRGGMADQSTLKRFYIERQALAVMDHPDIAREYEAGATADGNPYFVMEYCAGQPIDEYCDERRLSVLDRIRLVVRIARAVQRAHSHGVVHRDLKPSNVLVADCEGRPNLKVIDFGIAKFTDNQLADENNATRIGEMVGTPAYMSPEQASGVPIDGRTDVFAIGAMLFKLLTGTTPLAAPEGTVCSLAEIIQHVCGFEAVTPSKRITGYDAELQREGADRVGVDRPRQWVNQLRGDLDWITLRATDPDKLRRYATADDLADDLERFLNHQPVVAAAPTLRYRIHKFYQRRRAAVIGGAAVSLTILIACTIGGVNHFRSLVAKQAETHRVAVEAEQLLDLADDARARAARGGENSQAEFVAAQTSVAKVEALLEEHPSLIQLGHHLEETKEGIQADQRAIEFASRLNDARERAKQVDSLRSGDAFGRLAGLDKLTEAYVDFGVVPTKTSAAAAARKLLACPQSVRESLIESLDFLLNEEPLGVGIYLGSQGGRLTVADVVPGGPAEQNAQLRVGDRLLEINGVDLLESFATNALRAEAYRMLHGRPGDVIRLKFVRGVEDPRECQLNCGGAAANWAHEVLEIVDPEPWRMQLRSAVLTADLAALQRLSASPQIETQPPFSLIQLAGTLFLLERSNDAIGFLEIAQRRHPSNFWANHYLGTALAVAHDPPRPEESLRYLTAAVALRPKSVGARMSLASGYERLGDRKAARRHVKVAVDLSPGYKPLAKRLRYLSKSPSNRPTNAEGQADSNSVAEQRGARDAQDSQVGELSRSESLEAIEFQARKIARGGNRDEALQLIREAEAEFPDEPLLQRAKGVVLIELQDFTAARIVLGDAARVNPGDAATRFYHGVALQYSGDSPSAVHEYEAALQLRPDYHAVREYLDPLRNANGL